MRSTVEPRWLLESIPADWRVGNLGRLAKIYSGGTPDKSNVDYWTDGTVPWINSGAVNQRNITAPSAYITEDAFANSSARMVPKGALVMALAGQGRTKGTVARVDIDTACNQSMAAIIAEGIAPRFLFFWLESNYKNIRGLASDDLRDGLNQEMIRSIPCPIPPHPDQETISDFLDDEMSTSDALSLECERLLLGLEKKRAALVWHTVTKGLDPNVPMVDSGIPWVGDVPKHWSILPLRRIIKSFVDYRGATPTKCDDGIQIVTAANVKAGYIDYDCVKAFMPVAEYDSWMVRGMPVIGDVLLTMEAPLGQCAQVDEANIALGQRVMLLKTAPGQISGAFLMWYLLSTAGQSELMTRATGSTALGIKASHLKGIAVAVPPLPEQDRISQKLSEEVGAINEMRAHVLDIQRLVKDRRAVLITAAVTGQLDVKTYRSRFKREVA